MTATKNTIPMEHTNVIIGLTHAPDECKGQYCTLHNRSDHSMRSFPQHFRWDRMLMERICPHGVGHPDFDEIDLDLNARGVHGCDGCCTPGNYERLNGVVIND